MASGSGDAGAAQLGLVACRLRAHWTDCNSIRCQVAVLNKTWLTATALLGLELPYRRRGDVLRNNLAFALIRASQIVRGLRQGLTEHKRYAVADHVVAQLKEHGDLWRLSEEARGLVQGYVEHYNVRLNSAIGYIMPNAEGHAGRASAGDSGRAGPEIGGDAATAEEPPPAGRVTRISCGLPTTREPSRSIR